jgi:hypothetical protein
MEYLPDWLQGWMRDTQWHQTGFGLLDESQLEEELTHFAEREADVIAFARAEGFLAGGSITLSYKPLEERWIYVTFEDEFSVTIPLEATLENLLAFAEAYVIPGRSLKNIHVSQHSIMRVLAMREKREMAELKDERAKVFSLYVGVGPYDEMMVQLENTSVFNPYFAPDLIAMATASGGSVTQLYTKYSASIFTFYRVPIRENQGLFYIVVNYLPCRYEENKQPIFEDLQIERNPAFKLPGDVPVDCLAALAHFRFDRLFTLDDLKKDALRGDYRLFVDFLWYLDCPFAKGHVGDLEELFLEFVGCGHPTIEREILEIARERGWSRLLDAMERKRR